MSKFQRFQNIVIGLSMLISAAILILLPEGGCLYIMLFLAASLILRGISELIYYFTMARYMVGGKLILFIGAVFFDFGIFTLSLSDESKLFVLAYLLGFHAFAGLGPGQCFAGTGGEAVQIDFLEAQHGPGRREHTDRRDMHDLLPQRDPARILLLRRYDLLRGAANLLSVQKDSRRVYSVNSLLFKTVLI